MIAAAPRLNNVVDAVPAALAADVGDVGAHERGRLRRLVAERLRHDLPGAQSPSAVDERAEDGQLAGGEGDGVPVGVKRGGGDIKPEAAAGESMAQGSELAADAGSAVHRGAARLHKEKAPAATGAGPPPAQEVDLVWGGERAVENGGVDGGDAAQRGGGIGRVVEDARGGGPAGEVHEAGVAGQQQVRHARGV